MFCFGISPYFCYKNQEGETLQLHAVSASLIPNYLLIILAELQLRISSLKLYNPAD